MSEYRPDTFRGAKSISMHPYFPSRDLSKGPIRKKREVMEAAFLISASFRDREMARGMEIVVLPESLYNARSFRDKLSARKNLEKLRLN